MRHLSHLIFTLHSRLLASVSNFWPTSNSVEYDTWALTEGRADYRCVPSQWETSLQINVVSHRLGTNLESTLRRIGRNQSEESESLWLPDMKTLSALLANCVGIEVSHKGPARRNLKYFLFRTLPGPILPTVKLSVIWVCLNMNSQTISPTPMNQP